MEASRKEYVELVVDYQIAKRIKVLIEPFLKGLPELSQG